MEGFFMFQWGASFLSGVCAPWGASVLMGEFSKKIVGWEAVPPPPPTPRVPKCPPLWETLKWEHENNNNNNKKMKES